MSKKNYHVTQKKGSDEWRIVADNAERASATAKTQSAAEKIAKQALDSQNWLPEVAKTTHYHATYVRPRWIRDMKKIVKHGQHIFYRPWNWGNGEDEAGLGCRFAHALDACQDQDREELAMFLAGCDTAPPKAQGAPAGNE
jgi:hypothetical protein